jgi:hypothetical protein
VLVQLNVHKSDAHAHIRLAGSDDAERRESCIVMRDAQSHFCAHREKVCRVQVAAGETQVRNPRFEMHVGRYFGYFYGSNERISRSAPPFVSHGEGKSPLVPNVHPLDILPETIGWSCVESNSDTRQEDSCVSRLLGATGQKAGISSPTQSL